MISQVNIKNFKAFSDITIDFAPLTLLMGENGSGKSTIVQSILLSKQLLRDGSKGWLHLNGDYIRIGNGRDALFQGADAESMYFSYTLSTGQKLSFRADYLRDEDVLTIGFSHVGAFGKIDNIDLQYLSANRVGPQLFSQISSADTTMMEISHDGSNSLGLLRFSYHRLAKNDPRVDGAASSNIHEVYDHYLGQISSGARVNIGDIPQIDAIANSFSFFSTGELSYDDIRPTNVGFGLSYVSGVIVSCLIARRGDIVIIENPEAHLHTKGQRVIAELLARTARAGVQVICETHSREILYWYKKCLNEKIFEKDLVRLNYVANQGLSRKMGSLFPLDQPIGNLGDVTDDFIENFGGAMDFIAAGPMSS